MTLLGNYCKRALRVDPSRGYGYFYILKLPHGHLTTQENIVSARAVNFHVKQFTARDSYEKNRFSDKLWCNLGYIFSYNLETYYTILIKLGKHVHNDQNNSQTKFEKNCTSGSGARGSKH